jgi:CheY-like chemotaxis protein
VEFAKTIHSSGADLLALINEILDLSKIESGTMGVEIGDVPFTDLRSDIVRTFSQIAEDKGLQLVVELQPGLPDRMQTDFKRLRQVLKNLLSNAFKFTEHGKVDMKIGVANSGWNPENSALSSASSVISFTVSDTGIGIPDDKQLLIFEAFQQADGTTSRKYGGTGLGLSISREIARLLGGEITLESVPGEGSTFTFYLPETYRPSGDQDVREAVDETGNGQATPALITLARESDNGLEPHVHVIVSDDRANLQPGDRVLHIIEDDSTFARILVDIAHEHGFKCLVSQNGDDALHTARKFRPDAITLDLTLPGIHGYAVLDRLKHDPSTRHIPVQVISVVDDLKRVLKLGAFGLVTKPLNRQQLAESIAELKRFIERPVKQLLFVEDDNTLRDAVVSALGGRDVQVTSVGTGREALEVLGSSEFDCAIVDLTLPDMEWTDLISKIKRASETRDMPIIVHTGKDLTRRESAKIRKFAETIIVKGADSIERLIDETALFLHRDVANLNEAQKNMMKRVNVTDPRLEGKKVLIVDDDISNIFALTSVLERQQMEVIYAENGRDGISMLESTPGVDGVLMDIMMPGMDGFEAMSAIRNISRFRSVPIIAVTAKAMQGDRQKCLAAGASDYITKPVDTEQLLSLLRIWLDS